MHISDDGSFTELDFNVPFDQVNDVLKSLLVYDPAGNVASMTLDGLSPVEETFRGRPFTLDDMSALPRLLAKLQGGGAPSGMLDRVGIKPDRERAS